MPTKKSDLAKLTKLGGQSARPERTLEVFPNHLPSPRLRQAGAPQESMEVSLHCTEFTSICPATNQPDYATVDIVYTPDKQIVEVKSLKLYLETYRNVGVFNEHLAVDIGQDFVRFVQPKSCSVKVSFNTRGGIAIAAEWKYKR